ncbi:uncharacterized protein [Solanum tuberosum]|uniref:DUF7755 domain-containing protein n=2 Tax=Solanum tuberosum TaxID=4113 RepID=M1D551_SOLTU|nr:PREDICTED: uncharacterized protein LOC102603751 [Solanum tuberosum]KAH0727964.1 hypothetical protein KY284_003829 [Solanum tuberosum]KAH0764226.1 hypothetical protein KY285_000097 [Solanum tuberosum]
MESLFIKNLIVATQIAVPKSNSINPIRIRRICSSSWKIHFKKSDFQDFRDYVKPSRLLPATNVKFCGEWSLETLLNQSKLDRSNSIYQVKLQTSNAYGSDLTDINSEVLLCLIDENGDSILQRISAGLENARSVQSQDSDLLQFRRGSVDEFIFEGPKLGKLAAVWISPESGQWRLGGMNVTVISLLNSALVGNEKNLSDCTAIQYDFDIEDVLLGEKSDSSMMEFRPYSVTEFSEDNIVSLSEKTSPSSSISTQNISNEDTMKEYTDLKLSLLLYDAILTIAGSSIAFLAGDKSAIAFLTGGIGGFLYLLLVQRSVDGIPSSELTPSNRTQTLDQTDKGFKGSVLNIVLALAVTTVAAKYAFGDVARVLTPQDLMLGTIGFLLSKVSVILAAFVPITGGLRENK